MSIQFHGSLYGGAAELQGVVAWLACLTTLSMHHSGAGGGCTSSSDSVAQASTLLHHRKLKRGMWRHMRCLHDLGMAHTFHTAVPHTSAWPHPNAPLNATVSDNVNEALLYSRGMGLEEFRERSQDRADPAAQERHLAVQDISKMVRIGGSSPRFTHTPLHVYSSPSIHSRVGITPAYNAQCASAMGSTHMRGSQLPQYRYTCTF